MDDEGGDWFAEGDDEAAAEEAPAEAAAGGEGEAAAPAAEGEGAPEGGAAEGGEGAQPEEAQEEGEYLDPDKLLLFKHWIRPKFLQYKYLYDYRHNYYDDVIDYLDKRQRGLKRDIPRAQTWAERALRTYTSKLNRTQSFKQALEDTKLVTKTRLSGAFQRYHTIEYINRRYSCLLN